MIVNESPKYQKNENVQINDDPCNILESARISELRLMKPQSSCPVVRKKPSFITYYGSSEQKIAPNSNMRQTFSPTTYNTLNN